MLEMKINNKKELLSMSKGKMDSLTKSAPAFRREKWFGLLKKYLMNNETPSDNIFFVIYGLRRVGKTTLLKQLLSSLFIENQINYEQILFLKIDDLLNKGLATEDIAVLVDKIIEEKQIKYIFIDEINAFNKWGTWLKVLHDNFGPQSTLNVKLIATGSGSYELNKSDNGIGRFQILPIYPWNYNEYLNLNNLVDNEQNFHNYITFGQFPEIFTKNNNEEKWEFLAQTWNNEIKQLQEMGKIRESSQKINQILRYIALTSNNEIVKQKMSKDIQIDKVTLNNILDLLTKCQILIEVKRERGDSKLTRNKIKSKYYLASSNFIFAFLEETFDQVLKNKKFTNFIGSITETVFLQNLVANNKNINISYLKNKHEEEIDFSWKNSEGEKYLGEIKYKNNHGSSINEFFKKIKKGRKILFTKEDLRKKETLIKWNIKTQMLREYLQKENTYD